MAGKSEPRASPSGAPPPAPWREGGDRGRWWHRLSLRTLLAGSFALILVVSIGLMGSGAAWLFRQSAAEAASRARLDEVEVMWKNRPGHGPRPPGPSHPGDGQYQDIRYFAPFLAHLAGCNNEGVGIWDDHGQPLAAVGVGTSLPALQLRDSVRERGKAYAWVAQSSQYLLIPLTDGGHTHFMELINPVLAVDDRQAKLERFLWLSGGIAVALGLLAGSVLARLLTAPLERLSVTTARLADGAWTVRTGLPRGQNEVLKMANSFDRMVERVQQTFESQRRFVADASHELRTPLTTIGGMAEVLEQEGGDLDAERRGRAVFRIAREVERMDKLISDLLLLSSMEETGVLPSAPVPVQPMLIDLVERLETVFPTRVVTCECEPGLSVSWDEHHFSRAIGNLLDNAAKYSQDGATIKIDARRILSPVRAGGRAVDPEDLEQRAQVRVQDFGVGIGPEDLPKVFERFYRADHSRDRRTGGSGLGLALVKALVLSYGGSIRIDSVRGVGTTVTLVM